jgi:DNA-3-methyladenine glycosylase I
LTTRDVSRCAWAGDGDELMARYHDQEWGTPQHADRHLFEMLTLEGAQAGLSWRTILNKRRGYRGAFAGFDPAAVAAFGDADVARLLADPGIVRNRAKVASAIGNAQRVLDVQREFGSLDAYLWRFAPAASLNTRRASTAEVPATTLESDAMAKELKRRGFKFVGSTICYAFMQATGMVDDHVSGCFRAEGRRAKR